MRISDLDVICAGTTCVDMRNPEFDFLDDIRGDGLVADSSRTREVLQKWLEYDPEHNVSAMGGGMLNVAPLISLAGGKAGILTAMGNDLPGKLMKKLMHDTSVMPIIEAEAGYPSSVSFVKPPEGGKREAILHCPNAMDHFDAASAFKSISGDLREGAIVHYAYSGLSRAMDESRSKRLANLMELCRANGQLTMADTHTYSANPKADIERGSVIPQYKLLETVLPHLDFFFCSQDEAMMITNSLGYSLDSNSQPEKNVEFLKLIFGLYMCDKTPRIIGITAGTTATLMYVNDEQDSVVAEVKSPYVITDASNFVGAGDSFRAGFMLEWIKNPGYIMRLAKGNMKAVDLENLALAGHLMAACYVTRNEARPYGNIPLYENMQDVVNSGKEYTNKTELMKELRVGD